MFMYKRFLPVLIALLISTNLGGQIPQNSITFTFLGLSVQDKGSSDTIQALDLQLLETRISADLLEIARQEKYLLNLAKIKSSDLNRLTQASKDELRVYLEKNSLNINSNGFISAELTLLPDSKILEIKLYDNPGLDLVMHKEIQSSNFDDLLSQISPSVYELFGLSLASKDKNRAMEIVKSESNVGAYLKDKELHIKDISGFWQGDYGIGRVQVNIDGSAYAWLNDTDTLKLKVSFQGQSIIFTQDEANSPKLYLPVFPYSVANQIVGLARPISWEFYLSADRTRLVGKKNTSYFYIDQGLVVQVDNTYSREAVWMRIP